MPNQNTLEQQQQQQGDDFSNLVQMNQKFPSDINLDNQDIFDPGQLDIDTMLQEMGSLESFGNEFNSYFPPSNTGSFIFINIHAFFLIPVWFYSTQRFLGHAKFAVTPKPFMNNLFMICQDLWSQKTICCQASRLTNRK